MICTILLTIAIFVILLLTNILPKILCAILEIVLRKIRFQLKTPLFEFGQFSNLNLVVPLTSYFHFGVNIRNIRISYSWKLAKIIVEADGVVLKFI